MGAETFFTVSKGATAKAAFDSAVQQAQYDYGHSGYTGSVAEKDSFVVIPVPAGADPVVFAEQLVRDCDPRVDDKWGPAGCVQVDPGTWLFFGWASS